MRETLAGPSLARHAGRFVWLELDFDKPANQAFVADHAIMFTPSLFVLDPASGRAVATHLGGLAVPDLERFLDQGERALGKSTPVPASALAALIEGDGLMGKGRASDAVASYREALRRAAKGSPERERAVVALVTAQRNGGDAKG